jgi:hypothetical protein
MPPRKFPTPPPEQSAPRISAKTKNLFLSAESGWWTCPWGSQALRNPKKEIALKMTSEA